MGLASKALRGPAIAGQGPGPGIPKGSLRNPTKTDQSRPRLLQPLSAPPLSLDQPQSGDDVQLHFVNLVFSRGNSVLDQSSPPSESFCLHLSAFSSVPPLR